MTKERHRKHPDYYYTMLNEILALMDDQAGRDFDVTNFKKQFRIVALRHEIQPGSDQYRSHSGIIQGMVATMLPKMRPRQPSLI